MSPRRATPPLPPPTVAELYNMAVDDDPNLMRRVVQAKVTVSLALSCGHRVRPSGDELSPIEVVNPGAVRICDRCDDYTVVTRVTMRLVDNASHTG